MEHFWCNILRVHNREFGYNIKPTDPFDKPKRAKSTSEKISKALKGKKRTLEQIERIKELKRLNPNKFSEEAKIKHKVRQRKIIGVGVVVLNLDGTFNSEYQSAIEAAEKLNINNLSIHSNLRKNIQPKTITYRTGDFIFLRKELYDVNFKYIYNQRRNDPKKVKITNMKDGNVYIFSTLSSVYKELGIYHSTIREGIEKRNGIYKNFKMEYI